MKTLGKVLAGVSVAVLVFAAGMIYAQDVMKVAADSHTVLLENDQVRVLHQRFGDHHLLLVAAG